MPAKHKKAVYPNIPISAGQMTQVISPADGRKDEQSFLDARKSLWSNSAFRHEIKNLRERYPAAYWQDRDDWLRKARDLQNQMQKLCEPVMKGFWEKYPEGPLTFSMAYAQLSYENEARMLCKNWGFEGVQWVEWLVRLDPQWDPDTMNLPSLAQEPRSVRPRLESWFLEEKEFFPHERSLVSREVNLCLRSGISKREASRALAQAMEVLGPSKTKICKPKLTDLDREALRFIFKQMGKPREKGRKAMTRKVITVMKNRYGREMKETAVGNELRRWLEEQGAPVKRFITDKRDVRL